jgi:hypothetical protein
MKSERSSMDQQMMSSEAKKMMAWQNLSWEVQAKRADVGFENSGQHFAAQSRSVVAFARYYLRVDLPEHHMRVMSLDDQNHQVSSEIQEVAH